MDKCSTSFSGPEYSLSAGTGKHLSEAGCYTECACQDLNGLKDPRDELTTVEEDPDPKRNDVGKQV